MKTLRSLTVLFCLTVSFFARASQAASTNDPAVAVILQKDAHFWEAYNGCDLETCRQFFTDDVEFYHDKGGITLGLDALMESMKNGLCGSGRPRLRREAAPGTVQVFALRNSGQTYGAIISGQHSFYATEDGQPEHPDSHARFVHLWLLKDGQWKMARVLSFEHELIPYANTNTEIVASHHSLERLAGVYTGPQTGKVTVSCENGALILQAGDHRYPLLAKSDDTFFTKERPLTFQFQSKNGAVSSMIVRENGAVTEELTR